MKRISIYIMLVLVVALIALLLQPIKSLVINNNPTSNLEYNVTELNGMTLNEVFGINNFTDLDVFNGKSLYDIFINGSERLGDNFNAELIAFTQANIDYTIPSSGLVSITATASQGYIKKSQFITTENNFMLFANLKTDSNEILIQVYDNYDYDNGMYITPTDTNDDFKSFCASAYLEYDSYSLKITDTRSTSWTPYVLNDIALIDLNDNDLTAFSTNELLLIYDYYLSGYNGFDMIEGAYNYEIFTILYPSIILNQVQWDFYHDMYLSYQN